MRTNNRDGTTDIDIEVKALCSLFLVKFQQNQSAAQEIETLPWLVVLEIIITAIARNQVLEIDCTPLLSLRQVR